MLKLYNTLTRNTEIFEPLDKNCVRLYACGPTVYNFAHIGNFRTFAFVDILRRYLKYRGYNVKHVMNITDIEDKIIAKSKETKQNIRSFTDEYIKYFLEDMNSLDIQMPEHLVRATDHIPEMINLVNQLLKSEHAYINGDSVYYRISNFKEYGKLSHTKLEGNIAGARVDVDEYSKDDVRDFVLWKGSRPEEPSWKAEFGVGRPGWHLECSAMAMKYLGETFDIHCGGVDLIFPHHENEIAQSEAATKKPFVKYWLHAEHLLVDNRKMARRDGNYYTLRDLLEKKYSPRSVRYLLLSVPYRKPLNFTLEGLNGAEKRIQRLVQFRQRLEQASTNNVDDKLLLSNIVKAQTEFESGMDEDLNTAQALAAITILETAINNAISQNQLTVEGKNSALHLFEKINNVFGFYDNKDEIITSQIDTEIENLINERLEARNNKNFKRADEIRQELSKQGIILEDTKDGTKWKKV